MLMYVSVNISYDETVPRGVAESNCCYGPGPACREWSRLGTASRYRLSRRQRRTFSHKCWALGNLWGPVWLCWSQAHEASLGEKS